MNRFKQFATKVFATSVSALTVVWSLGLTALLPTAALAQSCPDLSAGDLFKVPNNSAVYLLNVNMERLYFPNSEVYHTWYSDFSGVVEIPNTCVDAYPSPSQAPFGVNYRPGSRLVKVQISPSVYAVLPGNTKAKIGSESVAMDLYGANWGTMVRDIPDVFWPNYANTGVQMTDAMVHDGMLVSKVDTNSVYYADDGELFLVDGTLPSYAAVDVHQVSNDVFNSLPMGSGDMEVGSLYCSWDPSQLCGVAPGPGPGPTPTGGDLTASLSSDTTPASILPGNVSRMEFTRVNLEAGSSKGVDVTSITICRSGVGDKDDFDEVWIEVGGVQHGSERSIISGDIAQVTFVNDPISIPAGGKTTVSLVGSLDSTVSPGHYGALGICNASAITTAGSGSVMGTFPITGNLMSFSSQLTATLTLTTQGSDKTVSVGDMNTELGRFQLSNSSPNDRPAILKSILLENEGTASNLENVLGNLNITQGGVEITKEVKFVGDDKILFIFDDYKMEDGATQSFFIRGDVKSAEVNDTIQFQLDSGKDFFAQEEGSVFGIRIDGNDGTATSPASNVDLKTYSLETGDINLSINNASSMNVAPGFDDVVLVDATLTVDSEFKADGLFARLATETSVAASTTAGLNASLENISLIIDGTTIDTVDTITSADGTLDLGTTGDYYFFNSSFTVGPGTHSLRIEADVKNAATLSDSVKLLVVAGDIQSPEYVESGDNVPSTELTGQADGSLVTINSSLLTVTRNDGNSSETIVGGSKNVEFMSFTLDANDSSDVLVTNLTFDIGVAATGVSSTYPEANVSNMRLFCDGVQQGGAIDLTNGSFSDVDFTIPESGQFQCMIQLDTNTVSSDKILRIDLESIDATDEEGNDVTVNASDDAALTSTNTETSDAMTVATSGNFSIALDGNTPDENILVAATDVWYPIVTYRVDAQDEAIKLTDLFLVNTTSTDVTSTLADARVQTLGLFDGNDVLRQSKTLSNGTVQFDLGSSGIVVPMDGFTKITVKAKLNTIVDADKTGDILRLRLSNGAGTGAKGVVVESTATGADLLTAKVTVTGTSTSDVFKMNRTKPTLTTVTMDGGGYQASGLSSGSNKVIYRFTVGAHSNEQVAWRAIKFDVDGRFGTADLSGVTGTAGFSTGGATTNLTSFQLYEVGTNQQVQDGNYAVSTSFDGTNGNGEVTFLINAGREEVVSAGSSKSYELRATLAGVANNGDFVDVGIDSDADDANNDAAYLFSNARRSDPDETDGVDDGVISLLAGSTRPYSFLWADNSGSPHVLTNDTAVLKSRDWTNDRLLDIDNRSWNTSASF